MADVVARVQEDDVVQHDDLILMKSKNAYLCVKKGTKTMLTLILDELIEERKRAKKNGDVSKAWAYKMLTVSVFGSLGSRHAIVSSKTCAEIITYIARYYLRHMIECASWCGYKTLYGDSDSIFVHIGGTTEAEVPMVLLPKLTRHFPETVEPVLALRFSARCYDRDGGAIPIFDASPETDANERSTGELYTISLQVAICGHGAGTGAGEGEDAVMKVCEPTYAHT